MAIAVGQCHGLRPTVRNRRCRLRSFPHLDVTLLDPEPLNLTRSLSPTAPTFNRSFSSPCWTGSATDDVAALRRIPRLEIIGGSEIRALHALVMEATIAMASGMRLVPVSGGLGCAYSLRNRAAESLAVLKPIMEDRRLPLTSRRLQGLPGVGQPTRAAETAVREVAAYLLDHGGFAGVPPTALIKVSHAVDVQTSSPAAAISSWRIASIQRFLAHDSDAGDVGPSRFSVSSVHRIGILDVRLLNVDRHSGNILVKSLSAVAGDCELLPIDHELCLPEQLDDPYFEWLHWPQAVVPFSDSEAEYISSLDPFRDAELLREELPSLKEASIRILILCTTFLKRAAEAGLRLADIGDMMTAEVRGFQEGSSQLETLCRQAEAFSRKRFVGSYGADEPPPPMDDDVPCLLPPGKPPRAPKKSLSLKFRSDDQSSCRAVEGAASTRLTKSNSFAFSADHEYGSPDPEKRSRMSFKEMSEEEWRLFLEMFEQLLPAAFGKRKRLGLKNGLGTSCEF